MSYHSMAARWLARRGTSRALLVDRRVKAEIHSVCWCMFVKVDPFIPRDRCHERRPQRQGQRQRRRREGCEVHRKILWFYRSVIFPRRGSREMKLLPSLPVSQLCSSRRAIYIAQPNYCNRQEETDCGLMGAQVMISASRGFHELHDGDVFGLRRLQVEVWGLTCLVGGGDPYHEGGDSPPAAWAITCQSRME